MLHHVFSQHLYRPAADPAEGGGGAQLRGRVGLHHITNVHRPSTLLQDHLFPALYCTKGRMVVHVHRRVVHVHGRLFMFTGGLSLFTETYLTTLHHYLSVILQLGSRRYTISQIEVVKPGFEPRTPFFASKRLTTSPLLLFTS